MRNNRRGPMDPQISQMTQIQPENLPEHLRNLRNLRIP
jgi:hypothetical protein